MTDENRLLSLKEKIAEYIYNLDRAGQGGSNWAPPTFSNAREVVRFSLLERADCIIELFDAELKALEEAHQAKIDELIEEVETHYQGNYACLDLEWWQNLKAKNQKEG